MKSERDRLKEIYTDMQEAEQFLKPYFRYSGRLNLAIKGYNEREGASVIEVLLDEQEEREELPFEEHMANGLLVGEALYGKINPQIVQEIEQLLYNEVDDEKVRKGFARENLRSIIMDCCGMAYAEHKKKIDVINLLEKSIQDLKKMKDTGQIDFLASGETDEEAESGALFGGWMLDLKKIVKDLYEFNGPQTITDLASLTFEEANELIYLRTGKYLLSQGI